MCTGYFAGVYVNKTVHFVVCFISLFVFAVKHSFCGSYLAIYLLYESFVKKMLSNLSLYPPGIEEVCKLYHFYSTTILSGIIL